MKIGREVSVLDSRVAMRDGASLAADVLLPNTEPPFPVLLTRTPYGRGSLRVAMDPVSLARAGWAVVLQDVRGRFDSEGSFAPFRQEVLDGVDTVAWCAAQPWSDGRVAMTGGSYNGATQWLAAAGRPTALKAISPVVSAARYGEGWCREGGALRYGFTTSWAQGFAASDPNLPAALRRRLGRRAATWPDSRRGPNDEADLVSCFPDYGNWAAPADDYWRAIDVYRQAGRLDLPGYHVAGWYDIFCEASIAAYQQMTKRSATEYSRGAQRLVIGPWTHAGVYFPSTCQVSFGPAADGYARGVPQELMAFLTASLDRRAVPTGVSAFVLGANRWRDFSSWPPPSIAQRWYLSAGKGARSLAGDGQLRGTPPPAAGFDSYRHDAARPVPNWGGRTLSPGFPLAGPNDQRPVESRDDVLVYTSEPLARELTVAGEVSASVRFASSAAMADVVARLVDVHPDGSAYNVVDSVCRTVLTPGRPQTVRVTLGNTAITFGRGHRIRLDVASTNFPHLDCLPSAEQTVHYGARAASYLSLPVLAQS